MKLVYSETMELATIDLIKLLASFLIFSIHMNALADFEAAGFFLELLSRWGVPFFFICSGFFLFRKSEEENGNISKETLKNYALRIGTLYLTWFIFNLPSIIYYRLYIRGIMFPGTWLLFIKEMILSSSFIGSWYLNSVVFSAWLVFFLSKRYKTGSILMITFFLYLLCVFTSVYKGLLPSRAESVLKFLCFPHNIFNGCFCFTLGKMMHEKQTQITKKINKNLSLILFVVSYLLYGSEIVIAKKCGVYGTSDYALTTFLPAFFIFLFCLQSNIKLKNGVLLMKLSTVIYCSQYNILLINGFLIKVLQSTHLSAYLVSVLVSVSVCIVAILINRNTRWKWTDI